MKGQRQITTIKLKRRTRQQLALLGRKGETYEDIIRRLIERPSSIQEPKPKAPIDDDLRQDTEVDSE